SCDDQGLAERVRVPGGPGTGLERDTGARHACRIGGLEQRVNAHRAGEPLGGSFAGGLGATSFDVHLACLHLFFQANRNTYTLRVGYACVCTKIGARGSPGCTCVAEVANFGSAATVAQWESSRFVIERSSVQIRQVA